MENFRCKKFLSTLHKVTKKITKEVPESKSRNEYIDGKYLCISIF